MRLSIFFTALTLLLLCTASVQAQDSLFDQNHKILSKASCDTEQSLHFGERVLKHLGTRGEACFKSDNGETYCLSKTQEKPEIINLDNYRADDRISVIKGLHLCLQSERGLDSCEPINHADGWDCDHYGPGPKHCFCDGIDGCIALSTLPTCGGGSCGNCSGGHDCCCTAP